MGVNRRLSALTAATKPRLRLVLPLAALVVGACSDDAASGDSVAASTTEAQGTTVLTTRPPTTTTLLSQPTTMSPTTAAASTTTSIAEQPADDLVGREWDEATFETDLGVTSEMRLGNQQFLPVGGGIGLHELVDRTSTDAFGMGGRHVLLFSDLATDAAAQPSPHRWVVTAVLRLELADDEQLSLNHIGCWVDAVYDESVFAIITPPIVGGNANLSARDWPARRAWRYNDTGLVEVNPAPVICELAGE